MSSVLVCLSTCGCVLIIIHWSSVERKAEHWPAKAMSMILNGKIVTKQHLCVKVVSVFWVN